MPVDYSKWDAIELSDDEDFECHPNVDKKSMIRWKQSQIHAKRKDRQDKVSALKMENDLSLKIVSQLKSIDDLNELQMLVRDWNKDFEKKVYEMVMTDRNPAWDYPLPDPFLKQRIDLDKMMAEIVETKNVQDWILKLENRQKEVSIELEKEQVEISKKITSETMKTGFDKSSIAQKKVESVPVAVAAAAESSSKKEMVVETIHDPSKTANSESMDEQGEEDYITYPPAEKFAHLTSIESSFKALSCNPELACQKYSDEILAEAFRLEMAGKSKEAKNCVHQSLILQYCGLLGKDGISMFFKRMETSSRAAMDMFRKDCADTFARIQNRVKEIHAQTQEEERREQLEALARVEAAKQPDGSFALPVGPDGEGEKRAEVFAGFDRDFQEAILLQDVDKINEYLATLSKDDAERIVKSADEVGLLTLQVEE